MMRKGMAIMTVTVAMAASQVTAQTSSSPVTISSLDLTPDKVSHLSSMVGARDYVGAETLLLKEIEQDNHSPRAGRLLSNVGSIYFLNHDYLNAAIAWKKAEAITPLPPDLQFSLAMAYIRIAHPDWARPVLESLAAHDSKNALYPYWLGRLDYGAQQYDKAMQQFDRAIALDSTMARAYDNLGLCYFYRNENERAIDAFKRAIELEQNLLHPSPWPHINLAATLQFLGRSQEAEAQLREALRLDPGLAEPHYHLGNLLAHAGQSQAAIAEFKTAIELDDKFAEPHLALANTYMQTGQKEAADAEVKTYQRLHASTAAASPATREP